VEVLGTSVPRVAVLSFGRNVIAGGGNRLVLILSSEGMAERAVAVGAVGAGKSVSALVSVIPCGYLMTGDVLWMVVCSFPAVV